MNLSRRAINWQRRWLSQIFHPDKNILPRIWIGDNSKSTKESKFRFDLRPNETIMFYLNRTNNLWVFCYILYYFDFVRSVLLKFSNISTCTIRYKYTNPDGSLWGRTLFVLCNYVVREGCEFEQAQTYDVSRITCLETLLHQFSSNMLQSYMKYKS